ncbi:hypothetical protein ACVWXS_000444 [Lysinibacillus sp. TE18511]
MKKSFILIVSFAIVVGLFYTKLSMTLVCIGIFAAFIGTLAGGGGLITIPAMMLVGIPIQQALLRINFHQALQRCRVSFIFFIMKSFD